MSFSRRGKWYPRKDQYVPTTQRTDIPEEKIIEVPPMKEGKSFAWKENHPQVKTKKRGKVW